MNHKMKNQPHICHSISLCPDQMCSLAQLSVILLSAFLPFVCNAMLHCHPHIHFCHPKKTPHVHHCHPHIHPQKRHQGAQIPQSSPKEKNVFFFYYFLLFFPRNHWFPPRFDWQIISLWIKLSEALSKAQRGCIAPPPCSSLRYTSCIVMRFDTN